MLNARRDIGWVWRWTLPPSGCRYDWEQLAAERSFVEQLVVRMQHFFQKICILNAPEACLLAAKPAKDSSGFSHELLGNEVFFADGRVSLDRAVFRCIEDSEDAAPVPIYGVIVDFLIELETNGVTGDCQPDYAGFLSLEKWLPKTRAHTSTKRPEYADFKYCTRHDLFTKRVLQV